MAGLLPQVIQNLQGFQSLDANKQQMDQQSMMMQQEKQADELLNQFQQGGGQDFGLVQKAVLLSPTKAKNVLATIGIADDIQKKQAASDIVTLRSSLSDPATFRTAVAKRVQAIKDRGGDPTDTIGLVSLYEQGGPQAVERELGFFGAALANEGYIKPELLGIRTVEPMSQYQAASVDLRKQELELKKLETKQKVIERNLQRETNELKKQDLMLKMQETEADLQKKRTELQQAENVKESGKGLVTEAYAEVNSLLSNPNLDQVIGTVETMLPTVRGESQDLINQASRLQSLLTVDNLKLMSGVLTDRDIAFLTNVASGINVTDGGIKGSSEGVKKRLMQIRDTLQKSAKAKGVDLNQAPQPTTETSIDDLLMKYGG